MKVDVEVAEYVAAGRAVSVAPDILDQRDEDGIMALLDESPVPQLYAAGHESVMVCPAGAMHVAQS